jgi:hypothetical protein
MPNNPNPSEQGAELRINNISYSTDSVTGTGFTVVLSVAVTMMLL